MGDLLFTLIGMECLVWRDVRSMVRGVGGGAGGGNCGYDDVGQEIRIGGAGWRWLRWLLVPVICLGCGGLNSSAGEGGGGGRIHGGAPHIDNSCLPCSEMKCSVLSRS